jgi:hypothetical protein
MRPSFPNRPQERSPVSSQQRKPPSYRRFLVVEDVLEALQAQLSSADPALRRRQRRVVA